MIATTGFFDGVHLGHRAVLQHVLALAQQQQTESAVITFWPHPRVILHRDAERVRLLNSIEEKKKLLYKFGIHHVHVLPFTHELANHTPEQFFQRYLRDEFQVKTLVIGYDHRLGNNADAGYETMKEIGDSMGISVTQVAPVKMGDAVSHHLDSVSSTKIREALTIGDVAYANACLGYRYTLQGVVVEGNKIGRTLGFPTANMQLYEPLKQLPANGVYAVEVLAAEKKYNGMMNIGIRPTVNQPPVCTIETHIFNFNEDIYGQPMEVRIIARIRDEQKFDSLDELKVQLEADKQRCKAINIR